MNNRPKQIKDLVITVSGYHGSGRTTQAKRLAKTFGLRYISSGTIYRDLAKELGLTLQEMSKITEKDSEIDRKIDLRTKEESKNPGVVIDATLSGWMAENPDIRIFLATTFKERVRRIAKREKIPYEEAEKETLVREESELERFKVFYNVSVNDLSIYDVIINTEIFDIESTARILKSVIVEYCSEERM